ncbi:MAG TPA: class I SAM-dependent methyltransferase [Steroidobacteraceae bacterium]|nr:class I SAM-dependent methyltransferase [Steroidobacteraceae bacterium]
MTETISRHVDFSDGAYANFTGQVLTTIREATFGEDIGQNSWVTAEEYAGLIDSLRATAGSHVLEVASGAGGPAVHLASKTGCKVTGVDSNPSGVATANAAATRAGLAERLKFTVADATRPLPFADNTVDALICIDSMNHFPNRGDSLKEWCRVLKPGGRAVFTDPEVATGPVTNEELAQRSSIGLFVFVPKGLNEELIVKAGLKLVSQLDATENAALVSRRWREARQRFRDDLVRMEGAENFEGVQNFLGAVNRLTTERRVSRIAYVAEK